MFRTTKVSLCPFRRDSLASRVPAEVAASDSKQGRKEYTPPPWKPSFFLFQGLRLYGVYPSFRTYGVYPFPLFSQENGIHHSFFCSVTSGSGDRPRKEGCHGGGVYSFCPCKRPDFGMEFLSPIFPVPHKDGFFDSVNI